MIIAAFHVGFAAEWNKTSGTILVAIARRAGSW